MKNTGRNIIIVLLVLAILAAVAIGFKLLVLDKRLEEEDKPPVESEIPSALPTPQLKTSYLFRDNILEKNKDNVLEILNIEDGEIVSENILSTNVETTYKFNKNVLNCIFSTAEINDNDDYNYSREHQVLVDGTIESTGAMPESNQIWKDGNSRVYDNNIWNKALKDGELLLFDRFKTNQGDILIITSNKKFDETISRSRTEKAFSSVIVGTTEYIDEFLKNNIG